MPTHIVSQSLPIKLEHYFPPETRLAATRAVEMAPNLTIARGTVLGQITASGKYSTYASGNNDGTQNPDVIAVYDCVTDANGQVFLGVGVPTTGVGSYAEPTLEVYYAGNFLATDLIGMDAGALTALKARTMAGGTIVHIP